MRCDSRGTTRHEEQPRSAVLLFFESHRSRLQVFLAAVIAEVVVCRVLLLLVLDLHRRSVQWQSEIIYKLSDESTK